MQWSELNLNRFGFKSDPDPVSAGSVQMSDSVGSTVAGSVSEAGSPESPGAKEVETNTVITNCIVQTSSGLNRVELAKTASGTALISSAQTNTDTLIAYENNVASVIVNHNGIFAGNIAVNSLFVASNLYVVAGIPIYWSDATGVTTYGYIVGDSLGNVQIKTQSGNAYISIFDSPSDGIVFKGLMVPSADNTYDIGSTSSKIKDVHVGGRLNVGKVTDAGPMTATAGTVGDIVFNLSNTTFYGCRVTGNPAVWDALS